MNEEIKTNELVSSVKELIKESRSRVAVAVNAEITMLYYQIGKKINDDVLKNDRAEYGKQVVSTLSATLTMEYGDGWGEKHLRHCMHFANIFPDSSIVSALRRQLSWTHFRSIIYIDDQLKRDFYLEICRLEKWSSRQLRERIKSMLYERTAISKKPEETISNDLNLLRDQQKLNPDLVFRDPYFLDFLGLKDAYSEKDLETSIIVELQKFIIELGSDFAFMARQKRITIDNSDYFIDLLFYHRRLRCLVAIDLKMGAFEAGFKGQMELYLRFLEKYEKADGENAPIGLILCSGKNKEHVELMQLGESNIRVADYLTALPSQEILQEKLHKAVEIARQKIRTIPT
ncbi:MULTISPECIES: YhcG family protein [Dyadobacter]|uniref:PDDEXK nuclease domain-containing protein n=1 Tax=Dyadobacter chenhuakuii TaxID=2909339 RepID=A0A9X1QGB6_9BACT|nr:MULTISPECIES: PDDEXK nuclease domain-containing protein [Dyadobacter]MCF2500870.1 PDDEXK nuclease domain-containing protein [Dyadobacter chenhuakuii]MCF2517869.1 PDDEXK nuclease domain-containing protein [Dyadobacter sp. CY351]